MRSQQFRACIVIFVLALACVADAAHARGVLHFPTDLFGHGQQRGT
jgi:hypothetical protein